jgi:hypothetical protein
MRETFELPTVYGSGKVASGWIPHPYIPPYPTAWLSSAVAGPIVPPLFSLPLPPAFFLALLPACLPACLPVYSHSPTLGGSGGHQVDFDALSKLASSLCHFAACHHQHPALAPGWNGQTGKNGAWGRKGGGSRSKKTFPGCVCLLSITRRTD